MELNICHLYPDLLNVYGDVGNILVLKHRAEERGIKVNVVDVSLNDKFNKDEIDIVFFGGGQDYEQSIVSEDLKNNKEEVLRQYIEEDKVLLAICGGYQLLGKHYISPNGEKLQGLGILDIYTEGGEKRLIGNTVIYNEDFDLNEEVFNFINTNFNDVTNYIIKQVTNMLPVLGGLVTSTAAGLWNVVLGIIISIYILIDKEKFCALAKKISYAILPQRAADKTIEITHRSSDTFGKFLSGKILDSLIIGILTFVVLTIFKMPYTLLVSVIVGITNIIPFFGPFIGAIPSVIIILFVSPVKALWFLLIILVIQQIDGNIIGPKILGDSIGISAFWILFSILVAGKFLGLVGMVIGVPLFAVIYSIIKEVVESQLDKKGMKTKTEDYM